MKAEPAVRIGVLTRQEMRGWDRYAIEDRGLGDRMLMEVAGRAAAGVLHRLYPAGRIAGVVGTGNNGGDAVVVLRTLQAWGRDVVAVLAGGDIDPRLASGWEIPVADEASRHAVLSTASVIVDGVLGTGATGAPRPPQAEVIRAMMAAGRPILALDGPSGVDLETGEVPGDAIRAEVTVTFAALKRGLLRFPGRNHAGRILVAEVGFPPAPEPFSAEAITDGWARRTLPAVPTDAHKRTLGTLVVVAGQPGMAGAAALVARAAARAGAGLVRLVSDAANREILQAAVPEAVFADRDDPGVGDWLADADAVVAGPGLGTDDAALRTLRMVVETGDAPLLLDADGLNLVAAHSELRDRLAHRATLLTPHPGEMGRLLGREVPEIVADPFAALVRAVERFECAVLLKGNPSLVGDRSGHARVSLSGHSSLASAGMGDTLSGVAGAFLARGCAPAEAGALALHFSARAGSLANRGRGLLPTDVSEALPRALAAAPDPRPDMPGIVLDLPAPL